MTTTTENLEETGYWLCSCGQKYKTLHSIGGHLKYYDHKSQGWYDPKTKKLRTKPPSKMNKKEREEAGLGSEPVTEPVQEPDPAGNDSGNNESDKTEPVTESHSDNGNGSGKDQPEIPAPTTGPKSGKKSDAKKPVTAGTKQALSPSEATTVAITPKSFSTSSVLIWQAQVVTEREWGWPHMELGDWLDTYLFETMKQRGIVLGGYQVLSNRRN